MKKKYSDLENKIRARNQSLEEKLRKEAFRIKNENSIYGDVNYDIRDIKSDMESLKNIQQLSDEEIDKKKSLIKEETKSEILQEITIYFPGLLDLFHEANQLLTKDIRPSKPLNDLLEDADLQKWTEEGIGLHKDKRDTCAFCRQSLPKDLWDILNAHFNQESDELKTQITSLASTLEKAKIDLSQNQRISKDAVYSSFQEELSGLYSKLDTEIDNFNQNIDYCIKILNSRKNDIFSKEKLVFFCDNSFIINNLLQNINNCLSENNAKNKTLKEDQKKAKESLRLDRVLRFIDGIDYETEINEIEKLKEESSAIAIYKTLLEVNLKSLKSKTENLAKQLKDEELGAMKVNEYLNNFFGQSNLKLVPVEHEEEEVKKIKFEITRNAKKAYNLSDGERSLIAFCYFIAKLEDEESKNKDLTIWIDDPISSLDNSHVFFVFSLIESVIVEPNKYKQLFLSTHNLDFLKYLKKLSVAKKETEYFFIEKISNEESKLICMPEYLKDYVTEFNYLFHQIYKCSQNTTGADHQVFYNFGNNLRKFLEAYLYYKYPANLEIKDKVKKFFNNNAQATNIHIRLTNELSHLEDIFDRSMRPIEIPEIPKLATYVLKTIKEKDMDQYTSLLESIGVRTT